MLPPAPWRCALLLLAACGSGELTGDDEGELAALVLNEVDCNRREWIEVANLGDQDALVDGWQLTAFTGTGYPLPAGFVIPPAGVARFRRQALDEPGFQFPVDCVSGQVGLVDPTGTVADAVGLAEHVVAATWGRMPDASGDWGPRYPTPGRPNQDFHDPVDPLYLPTRVIQVEIGLPPESVQALGAEPYVYVPGTVQITAPPELATPVLQVGVRLKGQAGSYRTLDGKAAFRIDLDRYVPDQEYLGIEHLVFNNMVQDPSMLHEAVTYRIFREAGVVAPRIGYAWLRVNGADYGLYASIEDPDRRFLEKHFSGSTHLYEGAYGQDVTPGYEFEIDHGDPDDTSDMDALVSAVAADAGAWMSAMAVTADLPQMRRMWAVEVYTGHWDGYYTTIVNNYFLHSDRNRRFQMLPWGVDQTLNDHMDFGSGNGIMGIRCRAIPDCFAAYAVEVDRLGDLVPTLNLDAYITEIQNAISPHVAADPRKPYSPDDVATWIQNARNFVATRHPEANAWACSANPATCP